MTMTMIDLEAQSGRPSMGGGTTPCQIDVMGDGHPCLDFSGTVTETAEFAAVLPIDYAGGGLTCTIIWAASSASSGDVRWIIYLERHQDDVTDLDTNNFAAGNEVTATAPSATGELSYDNITFTDGADMDSLAAGEHFRLRIQRDHDHADDDMAGDAELIAIYIKET